MSRLIPLLTVALATTTAYAQFSARVPIPRRVCLTPTLDQCQDPDWWETSCGRRHARSTRANPNARCNLLLGPAAADLADALPSETREVPDTETSNGTDVPGEGTAAVRIEPTPRTGQFLKGFTSAYVGGPAALTAHASNDDGSGALALFIEALKRAAWENNGGGVGSCEEYVYEKYYDYTRFEDLIARHGDDWRAIFDVAYDDREERGSIGTRGAARISPAGRDGAPLDAVSWPGRVPKNTFFSVGLASDDDLAVVLPDILEPIEGPDPFSGVVLEDPELIDALAGMGRYYRESWSWHRYAARRTARFSDDHMNRLDVLKEDFTALLAERASVSVVARRQLDEELIDIEHNHREICAFDPRACLPRELLERRQDASRRARNMLRSVDRRIEAALRHARDEGCLSPSRYAACDWSPRLFSRRIADRLTAQREADYTRCIERTEDDFDALRDRTFRDPNTNRRLWSARDYTRSRSELERYFTRHDLWMQRLGDAIQEIQPRRGARQLSQSISDELELGNDEFGLELTYDVSWRLFGLDRLLCNVNASFDADLEATGHVFEYEHTLLEGDVHVGIDNVSVSLRVLDRNVFDPIDEALVEGRDFNLVDDGWERSHEVNIAEARFPVLGIPLKVAFMLAGTVGLDYRADVHFDRGEVEGDTCSNVELALEGALTPYAKVDAIATLSVDVIIAEAGIKGRLTLVDIRLPFVGALRIGALNGDPGNLELSVSSGLDVDQRTLDGSLSIYARLLFAEAEKVIVRWNGLARRWNAFEAQVTVPLGGLLDFLDS